MADEQFPWLDWSHGFAPSNLGQNPPRAQENSNPHWRSPFYNTTSSPAIQTQLNNNSGQSQSYPSYQQQDESYVLLEDVVPYPSYRWAPAPATTREYQRQASHPESTSGLPAASLQSPTQPTGRQLPSPNPQVPQAVPGESRITNNMHSNHDAKRRRLGPSITSKPSWPAPKPASPVFSQTQTQPAAQNTQSSSQFAYSNSIPSQAPISTVPQATTQPQPSAPRTSQPTVRPGSQYVPPVQSRPASQASQRTASPATSQASVSRTSHYPPPIQSTATSRASPQTTSANILGSKAQNTSPYTAAQTLPQFTPPATTQSKTKQPTQRRSTVKSQNSTPQARPQALKQPVPQATTQHTAHPMQQRAPRPGSEIPPQPSPLPTTEPTSQPPLSLPVSRLVAQSTTPPVPHNVQQILQPQKPPSTQTAPSRSAPSRHPPTTLQTIQAPHSQPAHGSSGKLAAYSFQPANSADKSYLKQRLDLVSRLREGDAAQKLVYDPKTIARDILIASNRHPTEPTLNHHLFRLRDVFLAVDTTSDLETFRWDLVDPGKPSRDSRPKAAAPHLEVPGQTNQTAPQPVVEVAQPSLPKSFGSINNTPPQQQPPIQKQDHTPKPPPQQFKYQPLPHPQVLLQVQGQPQLGPPATAPNPPAPPTAESPSTPKSNMEKRRRGRPPGSTNKPKAAAVSPPAPTPSYPVFACGWGNCQMELHSLDLLKKHLFKVHVSYSMVCGWKGCAFTGTMPAAELMKHVKQKHLDSLAWKLGDGPAVPTSVERGSGSRTVPLTIPESNQPGNEDSLIFPASYSSVRAFNRVHGKYSQQEKAREILKAVQRLKEHIGVGLDPGGCELATPSRNERVSNDEDHYEVRSA
ncbi:putative C2H2 finger domain protein [Aspergillus lucknowensis]|uniref:C2H2-type domain-containing protein n=1 Tax=Aspergillus lucknowensis TaxID=176173 RepID=A0ABR4LXB9_9EURO